MDEYRRWPMTEPMVTEPMVTEPMVTEPTQAGPSASHQQDEGLLFACAASHQQAVNQPASGRGQLRLTQQRLEFELHGAPRLVIALATVSAFKQSKASVEKVMAKIVLASGESHIFTFEALEDRQRLGKTLFPLQQQAAGGGAEAIKEAGGIGALVALTRCEWPAERAAAAEALERLAEKGASSEIVEAGGIQALVYLTNGRLPQAARTLGHLAENGAWSEIVEAGGIGALVGLARVALTPDGGHDFGWSAAMALSKLARFACPAEKIKEAGGIGALVALTRCEWPAERELAAWALGYLADHGLAYCTAIKEADSVDALNKLAGYGDGQAKAAEYALATLSADWGAAEAGGSNGSGTSWDPPGAANKVAVAAAEGIAPLDEDSDGGDDIDSEDETGIEPAPSPGTTIIPSSSGGGATFREQTLRGRYEGREKKVHELILSRHLLVHGAPFENQHNEWPRAYPQVRAADDLEPIKVYADFYDPERRVGAEVKHVKNVKELYMVHDYIQRVTRAYGEPPLQWYVILFGGAADSKTYDVPDEIWKRVKTTWMDTFQSQTCPEQGRPTKWHICRYEDLKPAP